MSIWVSTLPPGWQEAPLKTRLTRNDGGAWGDEPDGQSDTVVLRSTEQRVDGSWAIEDPALRKLAANELAGSLLEVGDLVVTKASGSELHIGKTSLVTPDVAALRACYSNFMQRLRVDERTEPRFVHYWMNNTLCREQFAYLSSTTSGLANLNGTLLGSVLLGFPDRHVQERIANFLDEQTARIDALIAEKTQLIARLGEYSAAAIADKVLGRDIAGARQTTNVHEVGAIPRGWVLTPMMRLTEPSRPIMYGIVLPGPNIESGPSVPIVKGGDVRPARLKLELLNRTTPEIEAPFARARLEENDIVYSIRGTIGDAELVPAELIGSNITQDVARIAPRADVNSRWLLYVAKSRSFFAQLEQLSSGAAVRGINIFDLKRARVPTPPLVVQTRIADELDVVSKRLTELQSHSTTHVSRLREYRSSLISAAITGQLDISTYQGAAA